MNALTVGSTLEDVLRHAALPPLETRILLGHALQLTRAQMITQSQRVLNEDEASLVTQLIARRHAGEPIAYLIGEREFYGLPFSVNPAVLIPRPETELLVECALERLPPHGRVLDMGTGSGAIAVAIAHTRADVQVHALDVSDKALATAQDNAARHGVQVQFLQSDWFSALDSATDTQRFDLIVSNPPYIVDGDVHLKQGDLRFEPIDALTDHADGLSALRILCSQASGYLQTNGWLLMEHGYDQAAAVRTLLEENGFEEVQSWRDLAGIERVSGGRYPVALQG